MLVRSIALRNIRSYNDGEETLLELPDGVVLLEGDIGSGKSTLLYALEFALFGFSDMKGAHLLSEGRKEGRVSVTFESGAKEYTIDRKLRVKGDDVVQDECYISTGEEKTRLSPSDLKERVVSILGFNEPTHPRAESLVYRYAVFTPQEQMKESLLQNPDERLHVIRRVLGAQSYQVAAENSGLVERTVKELAYGLKKAGEDLEEKKDEMEEKSQAIAQLESDVPRLKEAEANSSRLVKSLEAEWKDSIGQREGLGKDEAKIPLLKQETADLEEEIQEKEQKLRESETQLAEEIEPQVSDFGSRPRPDSKASDLDAKHGQERERLARLEGTKQTLETDLAKTRDLLAKGVCPLCGQRISGDLPTRTEHSERELVKLEGEIANASASVKTIAKQLEAARRFEEDEKDYARAAKDRERIEGEIKSLRKKLQQSNGRLSLLRSELTQATSQVRAMQELSDHIADLESRLKQARLDDKRASLDLNQARTELADASRELERLSAEVKEKQAALDESRRLTSYQAWLSSFFRPTVELIEKQTLAQAAARFTEHFQRFFTSLVDDPDMTVRVKEDFSPLFEREGFEQDFEALSGGERTSMALAYRFALNSVVRESVSTQPELVILDEPTDGFSKEQIYKMRGPLEELDSRQVI
ncbi:MAG: AAA family ATPase, partial [Nitrososphaerota archaeon]|nr:AAA family ATPase [Nitrososphaerota archaeon]